MHQEVKGPPVLQGHQVKRATLVQRVSLALQVSLDRLERLAVQEPLELLVNRVHKVLLVQLDQLVLQANKDRRASLVS